MDEYLYALDGKKFIWAQKNYLELQKISRNEEGMQGVSIQYFEPLDPQSVRVVLDFSSWDDSTKDWIEQSEYSDYRIGQLRNAFPAYNNFLLRMDL
ncbi:hypothetical protein JOS77_30750 [Chromobacterium haemolyticum]|nr:hypothetical protein JOS77_30750 [Chromobacterium haemolyticum]